MTDPVRDGISGWLRDLELHRALRFLLHDDGASGDALPVAQVAHPHLDKTTGNYDLGASVRSHPLREAEYACVAGADHPQIGNRLSLKQFKAAEHILVLPLGASQHGRNIERALTSRAVNARIAV